MEPRCARCGSGTGVLGDIGQGSREDRLRRKSPEAAAPDDDINFECLSCGEVTHVRRLKVMRPGCPHCGSRDGVVVNGE